MQLSFFVASLVLLLTPGPTNTLLGAYGAAYGLRRAMVLPFAEALGYAAAVTVFHETAALVTAAPWVLPLLKASAGAWLLYAAVRLWAEPVIPQLANPAPAFGRVFLTTLCNPKAMFVALIVIPNLWQGPYLGALAIFLVLATLAGTAWTALGATLPAALRKYSYKGASVAIAGFSVAALASAFTG